MLAVAAVFAAGAGARADGRVSKGEAQSVFQAFGNGGITVFGHTHTVDEDTLSDTLVAIRPLDPWNGNHYCALDWHVIVLAIFDGADASYKKQTFEALREATSMSFTVDDEPIATGQTATKRFLGDPAFFGMTTGYWYAQGRVLAPDELAVGTHTLGAVVTDPEGVWQNTVTFTIDAPGTGACQ
jgi:hypothetical protein